MGTFGQDIALSAPVDSQDNNGIRARVVHSQTELARASSKISIWHSSQTVIGTGAVLTKGSFDILHARHLALFAQCVRLKHCHAASFVVIVESDGSVRARKGADRPYQSEAHRALQVALVEGVDSVLIMPYASLGEVIDSLQPRCYVKGMDTALEGGDCPTQEACVTFARNPEIARLGAGAEIVVFCDDGTFSTSALVRRIRSTAA